MAGGKPRQQPLPNDPEARPATQGVKRADDDQGREAMTGPVTGSREREAALLARCVAVANAYGEAQDQCEANVFALAANALASRFPFESDRLLIASLSYFRGHPGHELPVDEVIRRGWVIGLPRLRDRLTRELEDHQP